jgi:hypothetical protein
MGLEVYYLQDIRNALLAADHASGAALLAAVRDDDQFAAGFESGFRAALATFALAFGLVSLSADHGALGTDQLYPKSRLG